MKNFGNKKLQVSSVFAAMAMLFAFACAPGARGQTTKRLVTQNVDESKRMTLRGNVHPFARSEFDRGAMDDGQPVNRIFLLLNRSAEQQTALDKLMLEQTDPNSANFHKWLTPEEYGAKFGPSDEDLQAVKNWLASQGFTGIKTNNGKTIVEFNGTVGSVRRAFATEIHRFNVHGKEHFANVSDPQIPAALAPTIKGMASLHNFRKQPHVKRFGKFRRDDLTGETRPLFTFTDVNGTFFGVGPADFAKIYNVPNGLAGTSGFDGTGQSIAIVGRSNINPQDVTDFRSMFGLPAYSTCNLAVAQPQLCVILNGADPGTSDPNEEAEADLDVQWSGAVAPKATIKFVVSEEEQTDAVEAIDASAEFIIDNNIAPVMSVSFGLCEAQENNTFINGLWQQAAAEGITVSVSSGDSGSAGCDSPNNENSATQGIAISGTASTPFNVAVGGTDFDDVNTTSTFWNSANTNSTQASAIGYIPEVPWNDSCGATGLNGCASATTNTNLNIVAASGGPSTIYAKPAFQSVGVTGMPADGKRDTPDVSFFASDGQNKSFYIICQSDQDITGDTGCNLTKFVTTSPFHDFQAVGGTSVSTPAFAGVMALVNQKTGQRQGNANFVLYSLAKNETFANCNSSSFTNPGTALPGTCVFLDVTKSNNAVPCVGASLNCSKTSSGGNGVLQSGGNPAFTSAAGYDLATGLGSVNVNALLTNWAVPTMTATSTTISPATINSSLGTAQTITGTVTAGSGTPTGVVVLENATTGAVIDTGTLSGMNYTVTTTLLPAGTYNVKAHYGGDGTFAPSDSATTTAVSIGKQNAKVIVSFVTSTGQITTAAQTVAYGSPYILRVDVANNAGASCVGNPQFVCPTGTVALLDGGSPLKDFPNAQTPGASNVAQVNNRGFIEDQPVQLTGGSHSITATYTADANSSFISSTNTNTLSVTITPAATQAGVAASPSSITSGASVTLTATISSNSNSAQGPTGTVQFQNGATNLGTAVTCTPKGAVSNSSGQVTSGASCTASFTTTLTAFAPPVNFDNRPRSTPFEWLAALLAAMALILYLAMLRMRGPRRAYAYGVVALFVVASAVLAGCSGSGNSGGGGGGTTLTITAKYSGDTNYAASQGTGSVSVH